MPGADDEDETAYVFSVPDEGFSAVSILHDRLYTGILAPFLRLDIPSLTSRSETRMTESPPRPYATSSTLNRSGSKVSFVTSRLVPCRTGSFKAWRHTALAAGVDASPAKAVG
jgi:hypothetical protein